MKQLIALAMPPGQMFVDELRRAWDSGDAVAPVDLRLPTVARQRLLGILKPSVVIDENGERFQQANGVSMETSDALVMSTSGTTGDPKGVVLTHEAVRASAEITSRYLNVTKDDHWLACLPVAHIGGLSVITRALLTDTKLTVLPQFDADVVTDAAKATNGPTLVSLVTPAMRRIDATLFRAIVLGGGPVPPDKPSNAHATYGMTETGSGIVYDGFTLDGVEIRIDEDNEIEVKSPTLLRCYRDGTDPKSHDGWFKTGDAGQLSNVGELSVHGRIGDMINTGGEKVWPATVENALRAHASVHEALVFGEADDQWGQRVVAHIEVTAEVSADELREFVKQTLPAYATPKEIHVVDKLERTNLGKIKRMK